MEKMKEKKRVAVIGSGIGGAGIAALLAKEGFTVSVFERNAFPGGKTASYEKDGFICDMGVHYSTRGERGNIGEIARRVSADLKFIKKDPLIRIMKGNRSCDLPHHFTGLASLLRVGLFAGVKPQNYPGAIRAFMKFTGAKEEKDIYPYDAKTVEEVLFSYTKDEGFRYIIDMMCWLLLVLPPSEGSAGDFIWGLSCWARDQAGAYPKGGFRQIAQSFLDVSTRCGGDVHYREGVRRIRVEGGKVLGVETEKDFYPADVVVSNAGIKMTVKMTGEDAFAPSYVRWAMNLRDSGGGVGIKYAVNYKPLDVPMILACGQERFSEAMKKMENGIVPEDPLMFIPCPTLADPDLAPKGHHLLLVATVLPPSLDNIPLAGKVMDRVEQKMELFFPGLSNHTVWKQRANLDYIAGLTGRETADAIGLAQTVDQVGKFKPNARMPVEGLYLVGCDAGGRGCATEQAADSALKVAAMITRDSAG